ncbi:T9SS type A sorting domain-containing protein [Algibacter mikhailovii]|uniref:T9SS type A sorting domain-containing protein n=1 Tax=Algibacter mikhailovii TaxID=425498 RepID=UPI002494B8B2|nr:T9SS type A sorting domain-containing protein [Algibacter mikhailovii]
MKIIYTVIVVLAMVIESSSQNDWDGIPVPPTLEPGDTWVLQPDVSDSFNYSAPADDKGSTFLSKWDDWYHNSWSGPGSTVWSRTHSSVSDGELKMIATRYQTNKVNAGVMHSNNTIQYPVYIEARIKIMNSVLANGAWLLSPDDTQEIDFMEGYGADYSESANANLTWWAQRMHVSHHVFIRNPFQDWQPSEFVNGNGNPSPNPTWITRNDGAGNILWKDTYHTYGVYWKDPWHLYYFIDGVQVTKREGKNQVDPLYFTNAVNQGDTSNDTRTGLSKAMDIMISVEEQGWRSANGKAVIPTDSELANTANNTFSIDWIRTYKPNSSLSIEDNRNALKVEIYPNPSSSLIHINSSKIISKIDCFDVSGKLIVSKTYDDASLTFNIEKFAAGVYFLNVSAKDGSITRQKIIKH